MEKLKVIQIGTGHDHAAGTMQSLRGLSDYYEVCGVCEPDDGLSENFKNEAYSGLKRLTLGEALGAEGISAVFIETEENELVHYAQMFADKGFHIHMDKPGGTDLARFEHLANTLKNNDLAFQLGYMYRYNGAVKRCRQMVQNGELGEIFSVEAHMSVCHSKEKRGWLSRFDGGMMYFLGCHLVDIVYMFCGYPEEIIPMNSPTATDGLECKDYGFAVYKYKNGISFIKTNAAEVNGFARRQIVVTGSRGSVEINPVEVIEPGSDLLRRAKMKCSFIADAKGNEWTDVGKTELTDVFSRYDDMLIDFAAIVRGEKENPFGYEYEVEMHKMFLKSCGIA